MRLILPHLSFIGKLLLVTTICFACKGKVQQTEKASPAVYTLSDNFLLAYSGMLSQQKLHLYLANWADGTCSGSWQNPFTNKAITLQGEVDLSEKLRLKDDSGNTFVLDVSDPSRLVGYFIKKETQQQIPLTLGAKPELAGSILPKYFASENCSWMVARIEGLQYAVAIKNSAAGTSGYYWFPAKERDGLLEIETQNGCRNFVVTKSKEKVQVASTGTCIPSGCNNQIYAF